MLVRRQTRIERSSFQCFYPSSVTYFCIADIREQEASSIHFSYLLFPAPPPRLELNKTQQNTTHTAGWVSRCYSIRCSKLIQAFKGGKHLINKQKAKGFPYKHHPVLFLGRVFIIRSQSLEMCAHSAVR